MKGGWGGAGTLKGVKYQWYNEFRVASEILKGKE